MVLCTFIFTFLVVGKLEENGNKHSPDLVFSSFLCELHFGLLTICYNFVTFVKGVRILCYDEIAFILVMKLCSER